MPIKEYPQGLDGAELWLPYRRAKATVERYPTDPQEEGCTLSLIRFDEELRHLEVELEGLALPSHCPRFAARACPRMAPMGHEPSHDTCNYWDYAHMAEAAPGVEIYPEWQRFDCHKYYPLFQAHLVAYEMALLLRASLRVIAPGADEKLLAVYASFSSNPASFTAER